MDHSDFEHRRFNDRFWGEYCLHGKFYGLAVLHLRKVLQEVLQDGYTGAEIVLSLAEAKIKLASTGVSLRDAVNSDRELLHEIRLAQNGSVEQQGIAQYDYLVNEEGYSEFEEREHERMLDEQLRYGYMSSEQAQAHFMKGCTCIVKELFGLAVLHFNRLSRSPLHEYNTKNAKLREATEKIKHSGTSLSELVEHDRLCLKNGHVKKLNHAERGLWTIEKNQLSEEVQSFAKDVYLEDLARRKARWLETEDGLRATKFQDAFERFWSALDYPEFKHIVHSMRHGEVYARECNRNCPALSGWFIRNGHTYATIRASELESKQLAMLCSLHFQVQVDGSSIYITKEEPGVQRQFDFKVNDQLVVFDEEEHQLQLQ